MISISVFFLQPFYDQKPWGILVLIIRYFFDDPSSSGSSADSRSQFLGRWTPMNLIRSAHFSLCRSTRLSTKFLPALQLVAETAPHISALPCLPVVLYQHTRIFNLSRIIREFSAHFSGGPTEAHPFTPEFDRWSAHSRGAVAIPVEVAQSAQAIGRARSVPRIFNHGISRRFCNSETENRHR